MDGGSMENDNEEIKFLSDLSRIKNKQEASRKITWLLNRIMTRESERNYWQTYQGGLHRWESNSTLL